MSRYIQELEKLKTQLEQTTEASSIHKALYVEALKQNIKLEEKLKEARVYWYNQGWFDATMEINEDKRVHELEDVLRQVDAWSDSWGTDPEAHLEPVFIKVKEVLTKGPPQNPTSSN